MLQSRLYYKKHFQVNSISINMRSNNEFEFICVDVYNGRKPYRFCCYYIPPRTSISNECIQKVCRTINSFLTHNTPNFIIGDFNLPTIDWENLSSNGIAPNDVFLSFCADNCLKQCVTEATHEKGNILDLVLCNSFAFDILYSCSVLPPLATSCDHSIVSFKITIDQIAKLHKTCTYHDFKSADFNVINYKITYFLSNWKTPFDGSLSLQDIYNCFISCLVKTIDEHVPLRH